MARLQKVHELGASCFPKQSVHKDAHISLLEDWESGVEM